jgi:hypothetical protein
MSKNQKLSAEILSELTGGGGGGMCGNIKLLDMANPLKWRSWLMGGSRSIEHAKWPFLFVMFNMTLGGLIYPMRVFADPVSPAMSDCTFTHIFSLSSMAAM